MISKFEVGKCYKHSRDRYEETYLCLKIQEGYKDLDIVQRVFVMWETEHLWFDLYESGRQFWSIIE